MIVVDASVLANALADDGNDGRAARSRLTAGDDLVAPDLVDVETVAVIQKRWHAGDLSKNRFSVAVDDLENLDLVRYPALPLMRRAFELRNNVAAYDAVYVALGAPRLPTRHGGSTTRSGARRHLPGRGAPGLSELDGASAGEGPADLGCGGQGTGCEGTEVILWRLAKERDGQELSEAAERRAVRLIAATFLVLAVGVGAESVRKLILGAEPDAVLASRALLIALAARVPEGTLEALVPDSILALRDRGRVGGRRRRAVV